MEVNRALALGVLPGAYLLGSTTARVFKFGGIALEPRALLETASAALLLGALTLLLTRVRGGRVIAPVLFVVFFGVNLLGMLVAGTLGLTASLRLLPQIPEIMFIQTAIQDESVRSSLLKAGGFWLAGSAAASAAWCWLSRDVKASPKVAGVLVAIGLGVALIAQLLPLDIRARDRDAWVALAGSLPGGTQVSAPDRVDDDFNDIAIIQPALSSPTQSPPAPRYVLVVIWETGINWVIGWPDELRDMPNLRALMGESLVGERHLATAPQSSKSIFSIMTGLYPQPSATVEQVLRPDGDWHTLGDILGEAGYDTGAMTSFTGRYERLDEFFQAGGFDTFEDRNSLDLSSLPGLPFGRDDELAARAGEWLTARDKALLVMMPSNSHHPYWYPDKQESLGNVEDYHRAMRWQDEVLGQLVTRLREDGIWDDTALVVCADHGNYFGLVPDEGNDYVRAYHVPLVMRIPGVMPRRIAQATSHVDLVPTIAQACGLAAPNCQGESLLGALPKRLVFQTECHAELRVSCTDGELVLVRDAESGEEQAYSWFNKPNGQQTEMSQRLARFFPYQYWHIQDRIDGR